MRLLTACFLISLLGFALGGCAMPAVNYSDNLHKSVAVLLKQAPALTSDSLSLAQANHLFQQEKFQQSLKANLPWAKAGNVQAQLEIGYLYEFGRGVKANGQRAALWYYAAIRPNAYNHKPMQRGIHYYYGLHRHKQNYMKAAKWFRMAAELGDDRY